MSKYSRGFEVLDVVLQYLLDYVAEKWNLYTYNTWTAGRVALATPSGAHSCVLWSTKNTYEPIRWSRVLKET